MRTFYAPPNQISSEKISITGNEKHHLSNVLRLSVNDEIRVLDGHGNAYIAVLTKDDKEKTIARILEHQYSPLPPFRIKLIQGLPKFNKMDLIVQKCTELGVDEFIPVICHRTIPKLSEESAHKRLKRWQQIVIGACKQSGRMHFPKIHPIIEFEKWHEEGPESELNLIFWTGEKKQKLKDILKSNVQTKSASLLVGPEGGFTNHEIAQCIQLGAIPVSFGNRILRTETAAIAGLTILLYEFGRLG